MRPRASAVERETKEKDGVFTGRYAVNPGQRRVDPDLGRRLRPDGVRHRRDHGRARARRARPRLRASGTASRSARSSRPRTAPRRGAAAFVAHTDDEVLVNSGEFSGLSAPEGKRAITAWLAGARARRGDDRLPPARLAALAPALLGLPDPDRPLRARAASCRCPRPSCPCVLPEVEDYLPKGKSPLAAAEDWVATTCPTCGGAGAARDRHDGHVRRLVLVLPALRDARNDDARLGSADRRLLAAGQAVHRRRRARRPAPAVRAVLHQGAERHRAARLPRAVLAPVHPGDDLPARREDVEVEGQRRPAGRRRSRGTAPTRCASTSCTWARPSRTRSGATPGIEGTARLSTGSGGWCSRSPRAAPVEAPADGELVARRAPDDRPRLGRHPAPLPVPHADRRAVRARQRDLPRQGRSARAGEVRFATETVVSLIQPYAPHVAEELWERLGHERLWEAPWPVADPAMLVAARRSRSSSR